MIYHWTDDYALTTRARNCLRNNFPTEDALRATWPIPVGYGGIPNLGRKSILELSYVFGLPLPAYARPDPTSTDPRLSPFSDDDLRRELDARRRAKVG